MRKTGKFTVHLRAALSGNAPMPGSGEEDPAFGSWLSPTLLLVVIRSAEDGLTIKEATVADEGAAVPLEVRSITCGDSVVTTISMPDGATGGQTLLHLQSEDGRQIGEPISVELIDIQSTMRRGLTALDAQTRCRVLEFIVSAPISHGVHDYQFQLSKSLSAVRDALRERLPQAAAAHDEPRSLHVDSLVATSDRGFYMKGWMRDEEAPIRRVTAVSPEGERVEFLDSLFRHKRTDVQQINSDVAWRGAAREAGFIVYIELRTPSHLREGWIVEFENEAGSQAETRCPRVLDDPASGRMHILEGLPLDALPNESLMSQHVHPAVSNLGERYAKLLKVKDVVEYGTPDRAAETSLIIPLYKRIDFLEHQLAQFVHDPDMWRTDLIYVLDSPELERNLRDFAAQLYRLYRMPFRCVFLDHSSGFAGANRAGAGEARGDLLLLLNSDILPNGPGWLEKMVDFYKGKPNIGALGVKLLYPDDSLQHAGMFFDLPGDTALAGLWRNAHYFKGFASDLPAANVARPVPALTGACLMISRELWAQTGGFSDIYIQGDHEDSDLCLRLLEAGHENWYLPDVALYHLEGQSYPGSMRQAMALYNRWLHTRIWGEQIQAVMEHYPSSFDSAISNLGESAEVLDLNLHRSTSTG
jgi:GT2 family glycosyltransferase